MRRVDGGKTFRDRGFLLSSSSCFQPFRTGRSVCGPPCLFCMTWYAVRSGWNSLSQRGRQTNFPPPFTPVRHRRRLLKGPGGRLHSRGRWHRYGSNSRRRRATAASNLRVPNNPSLLLSALVRHSAAYRFRCPRRQAFFLRGTARVPVLRAFAVRPDLGRALVVVVCLSSCPGWLGCLCLDSFSCSFLFHRFLGRRAAREEGDGGETKTISPAGAHACGCG